MTKRGDNSLCNSLMVVYHINCPISLADEPCRKSLAERAVRCAVPVTPVVGWDGQVGEEDRNGHHASVQIVDEVRHLIEHALPDFSACMAHGPLILVRLTSTDTNLARHNQNAVLPRIRMEISFAGLTETGCNSWQPQASAESCVVE